jgi:hypothetical protein
MLTSRARVVCVLFSRAIHNNILRQCFTIPYYVTL